MSEAAATPRLGLGANWRQFALLVLVNAFVGGMVGLERAVLPLVGEQEFVQALLRDITPAPERQAAIVAANRSGRPLIQTSR